MGATFNDTDPFLEISSGNISGVKIKRKFGCNNSIGTSIAPVCTGGNYRTPTGTVTLAAISTSVNDTSDGSGAREITLEYLDSSFVEQVGTISMNGTTETTDTIAGIKRLTRAYVSSSGSYSDQSTPSQSGTITITVYSAGDTWAILPELATGFGSGQSLIGAFTVPASKILYVISANVIVEDGKSADIYFFKRENAHDTSSPYSGIMRIQNIYQGVAGELELTYLSREAFPEKTDLGFMAKAASMTSVSVEFEYILIDN